MSAMGGRVPNIRESILWTQRIEKEDKVNATSMAAFSLRAAVGVAEVPAKFKPGHVNPAGGLAKEAGFDPVKLGWEPDGPEASEFRRCINLQTAASRQRYAYPETSYQEHGWLLLPPGDPVARTRKKKLRYGLGWEWKAPADWSESTAAAPLVDAYSNVSAAAPSVLSAIPESQLASNQPGKASVLSASAPNILAPRFGDSRANATPSVSSVSKPSSIDLTSDVALRLKRREEKLAEKWQDAFAYQNGGRRGQKWYKPLGQTDATKFADDFTKATGGVPLYKMGK
ncbi:unnamed protein product [Effrenium voratum]|nr:unnamed protein product [Effrenium voratum]